MEGCYSLGKLLTKRVIDSAAVALSHNVVLTILEFPAWKENVLVTVLYSTVVSNPRSLKEGTETLLQCHSCRITSWTLQKWKFISMSPSNMKFVLVLSQSKLSYVSLFFLFFFNRTSMFTSISVRMTSFDQELGLTWI